MGLPYAGLPYAGLAYPGYAGLPYLGRKRRDADADASVLLANGAPNALPVVTIPEPATTGYAVGASGAIGGQAPVAAIEPVAVATPAIAAASLGYAAAPLGYALGAHAVTVAAPAVAAPAVVAHTVAAPAVAAPAVLGYAGHPLVYGKSAPCVNAANIPVPCAHGLPALPLAGLAW